MRVYLGKDMTHATGTMTSFHTTVAGLTTRIQNVGHKLYMVGCFLLLTYLMTYMLRP